MWLPGGAKGARDGLMMGIVEKLRAELYSALEDASLSLSKLQICLLLNFKLTATYGTGCFSRIISCCLFEFKVISIKPISLISEHNNAEQLLYSMSTKMEKNLWKGQCSKASNCKYAFLLC